MPHVIVKIYKGRSEEQKTKLAQGITEVIMKTLGNREESISICIEDIQPNDWVEKVYKPDILDYWDKLYRKPGYDPLANS